MVSAAAASLATIAAALLLIASPGCAADNNTAVRRGGILDEEESDSPGAACIFGGTSMNAETRLRLALEAAAERPDYECHCPALKFTPVEVLEVLTERVGFPTVEEVKPVRRLGASQHRQAGTATRTLTRCSSLRESEGPGDRQVTESTPCLPSCGSLRALAEAGDRQVTERTPCIPDGPFAPVDGKCNKPSMDYNRVYGSLKNAQKCFSAALSTFTDSWKAKLVGPTLRAAFHDCGTYNVKPVSAFGYEPQCGGCNGSFKAEIEAGIRTDFCEFPQQNGMEIFYSWLWGGQGQPEGGQAQLIRAVPGCERMTNADLISIAGYFAVMQAHGVPRKVNCGWYPGRLDAAGKDDTRNLPPENLDAVGQMAVFDKYDFGDARQYFRMSLADTVTTLVGAHTVGLSRAHVESIHSLGIGPLSGTPDKFDGNYYAEVTRQGGFNGGTGWFASDLHLRCNTFRVKTSEEFIEDKDAADANDRLQTGPDAEPLLDPLDAGGVTVLALAPEAKIELPDAVVAQNEDYVDEALADAGLVQAEAVPQDPAAGPGGTPGPVDDNPDILFERITCNDEESPFLELAKVYAQNYLDGTNQFFRQEFCKAYQAMSTIGFQFPDDYENVSALFQFEALQ